MSDGDVVHHFIIRLGIPLAVDGQTCRENQEQSEPQGSQTVAMRRGKVISSDAHFGFSLNPVHGWIEAIIPLISLFLGCLEVKWRGDGWR